MLLMLLSSVIFLTWRFRHDKPQRQIKQQAREQSEQRQNQEKDPDDGRVSIEVFADAAANAGDHPVLARTV